MPLLTAEQIEQLRQIIRDASTAVAISTTGMDVSDEQMQRLVDDGYIDPGELHNVVLDSFELGRIMAALPEAQGWSFQQLQNHLARQPVELTAPERLAVDHLQSRAGQFCVGLGTRAEGEMTLALADMDQQLAEAFRFNIQNEAAQSLARRETVGRLTTRLRQMSQDWARDWGRIASTESHMAHQMGYIESSADKYGTGAGMAKIPEDSACPDCRRLYLGPDGKPRVEPIEWWQGQGVANYGRKRADWLPVTGAMHPWCLLPESQVETADGPKRIEDVVVGDRVLQANRTWGRVTALFRRHYIGDAVRAHLSNGQVLAVTSGHSVLGSCGHWQFANLLKEGSKLRGVRVPDPKDRPSIREKEPSFARIFFCFDGAGMPMAAVYFNGEFARPIAKVNEPSPNELIILKSGNPRLLQKTHDHDLPGGQGFPLGSGDSVGNLFVRINLPAARFMSRGGIELALLGAQSFHADLLAFRSRSLTDPSLMETLDDEGSGYPELAGYRLYGQISLQVHRHDINAEVLPAPTGGDAMISEALQDGCRADPEPFPHGRGGHPLAGVHANEDPFRDPNFLHITVQSVDVSVFQGECFNLTVEETNTYVSAGVVNKNCQCQVTRVPEGWAFNDAWDLVPAETLTEGDGEGEEEEKSLRPRAAADRMEKARKLAYRTTFRGLPISIENRKGSKRHWYDPHTKTHGETLMRLPYGYIRLTEAADGDHVDCFLGPHEEATHVYVVHQRKAPHFDEPDEDKVMLGQLSAARAKRAYLQHFDNPKFFGSMTAIPIERFVEHCKSGEYRDGKEIRKAEPARKMSQQTAFTWAPAPGSKKGAVRRRRPGGGWDYQYPPFTIPKHPETHRGQGIYWARQQEVNRSMAADPIATVSTIYLNVSGGGERARFVPVSGDTPLADRNLGVQITAHEVPKSAKAIERFAQHAKRSNLRLMVDSGEFPRFAAEMSIPPARAKLVDLERGHDAAAIAAAKAKLEKLEAKAKPLDFDRIFSDYERLADAFPSGTLTVVAPDRIGDAEETARIRAQYHDKIAEIVKRGVKLIVPFQSSTAEGLGAEYVAASEAFGEGTFVIGLPMAKKPMPMDVMVPFVTDLYRAGRFPKLHFLGGSHPERMAERTAQLVSAAYWSSRGLPKARVLELCATPRESLRSMSRVKSASDVLTDEAEAVLRPRMLKWAKAEGIDTEDETELWVQFFDAHPEEFDLEFAEKEGAFREWAQELVQFDTSTVNRAVIFRKQHALTGEQELVEGYLEEKEKKERHPGTLDRYLQAKEFQLERFVPSERSGIESLYGRYDKSYLPRWRDLVKSGQFRGSAGQIQSRREVGTMGNVGQPARTAGENTYGAQPTTDHPYGPDARKKKRKKKRKKQDRTAEKKRMAFSPVSYTDGYVRDKPTVDLDLESDAERNREWVDNAQDARAARLTGRRLTVRPQDMRS